MSWWKSIRDFFLGPEKLPDGSTGTPLEAAVWLAMAKRIERGEHFTTLAVADEASESLPGRTVKTLEDAKETVDALYKRGLLEPYGWTRTMLETSSGKKRWLYHPKGAANLSLATPSPPPAAPAVRSATPIASPLVRGGPAPRKGKDPYDVGAMLSLSKDELRTRSLRIQPWKTAWIGRTDVIPPESDERTALIDRGLELRGFLSRPEIVEIHRIGDLWLRHRHAAQLAESLAKKNVEEALAQRRIQKQLEKEKKRAEAAKVREARAADVARRRAEDVIHLGRGVSGGLSDRRSHVEALEKRGLPVLSSPADVAKAIGISIRELRFLAFHSEAARRSHYVTFEVPKKSGGVRRLSAPMPRLRVAQEWIHANVLAKVPTSERAHGFAPGRSIVTNARPHAHKAIVANLDLVDFFPTITFPRVRGALEALGYSPAVATVLALLTTEAPRERVEFAGTTYFVATGPRGLPQGACTSPALSNLVAWKLDRRLGGWCDKHGWTYTRYADDLSFSADGEAASKVAFLLARVRHVAEEEGFRIHEKKTRVQRPGGRQTVTGLVVNETKLRIPREDVRLLRAILHNAKKTGLAAQNRAGHPHFEAWLRGKIAYLRMVDPARGDELSRRLDALGA